jgi:hypothetical protein
MRLLVVLSLVAALSSGARVADAQPRGAKPPPAQKKNQAVTKAPVDTGGTAPKDAPADASKNQTSDAEQSEAERRVKQEAKRPSGAPSVEVEETGQEGVKTYKFGPVEVEGRLKSPQVVYFLRRVRAEFAAGLLGHRSFLRELSDTRRSPALR